MRKTNSKNFKKHINRVLSTLEDISKVVGDLDNLNVMNGYQFWSYLHNFHYYDYDVSISTYSLGGLSSATRYSLQYILERMRAASSVSLVYSTGKNFDWLTLQKIIPNIQTLRVPQNHSKIYAFQHREEVGLDKVFVGSMNFAFPANRDIMVRVLDPASVNDVLMFFNELSTVTLKGQ